LITVVPELDRSFNLIIFGLSETNDKELVEKIEVFEQLIGEKPRIGACRLRKKA